MHTSQLQRIIVKPKFTLQASQVPQRLNWSLSVSHFPFLFLIFYVLQLHQRKYGHKNGEKKTKIQKY